MLEVTDTALVRSAVEGNEAAFHALVDRHSPALFRSALALSRNRADAEDLLQDTLVAAYRGLAQFAGRSSVKTWLTRILTRKAFKALAKGKRNRGNISIDAGEAMPTHVAGDRGMQHASGTTSVESRLDVMQVLQTLTPPHREVLVLREIQGLSYDEIAESLNVPRGTVESRLFRARAEFRERYENKR